MKSSEVLSGLSRANQEAAGRYGARSESLDRATRLLRPEEVAGDYDAGRLLTTTLNGGVERPLTSADLEVFRRNVLALGKAYKGGITAKGVIDRSLEIDRERANREIRVALPHQSMGGKVHFVTNAGPKSDVTRHHVIVEFLNFNAAIASPAKPADLTRTVATGPLRCACDCGRWTFWFSYLATIGQFNAGRPQPGFPTIRNPDLHGVACKHILRVMQQLGTPLVRSYVEKMILRARGAFDRKAVKTTAKEAREFAAHQAKQINWKRSTVESTAEKRLRLAQQRRMKEIVEKANASIKKPTPAKMEQAKKKFAQSAHTLAAMGGISPKMLAALLAKLK